MQNPMTNLADKTDFVRQEYKKYKRKKPPPDFSDVIDIRSIGSNSNGRVKRIVLDARQSTPVNYCKVGLKNPNNWDAFLVNRCPGFMIIRNPFLPAAQKYWSHKALTDYTKTPYPCNLDKVHIKKEERDNWESIWHADEISQPSPYVDQLRWVHLGYHFDYNFVNYKEEKYYGFPEDLVLLMKAIAMAIGYETYVPETGIINYYPLGSSMGGHTDHYEEELDAPLLSLSFGQKAVFLIGGKTKDVKPEAIWIKSGDIIIMAGDSRVAYHAVPCIVKEGAEGEPPPALKVSSTTKVMVQSEKIGKQTLKEAGNDPETKSMCFEEENCHCETEDFQDHLWAKSCLSDTEWEPFATYLSKTRININVRQVHKVS